MALKVLNIHLASSDCVFILTPAHIDIFCLLEEMNRFNIVKISNRLKTFQIVKNEILTSI